MTEVEGITGMAKRIVFFSDGTAADRNDRTNVWRTYKAMLNQDEDQPVLYDPGVGTRWINLIRGRVFGVGLALNVRQGFKFISDHFEEGATIYLFGFSRGAYTVRSLASMISLCGLAPPGATWRQRWKFWKAYKKNRNLRVFPSMVKQLEDEHGATKAQVEAICVWDTVGSIGRQARTSDIRRKLWHRFHRMTVWEPIQRLYHAVSIDERRTQYFPHTLRDQGMSEDQLIEEVWFPGVHSDIGGGYKDDRSLADIALQWMLEKVKDELKLAPDLFADLSPDPLGPMHNTEGGIIFGLMRKRNRAVARASIIHAGVRTRIAGPLQRFHPHREPSGNYEPLALTLANFRSPPDFGLDVNYQILE